MQLRVCPCNFRSYNYVLVRKQLSLETTLLKLHSNAIACNKAKLTNAMCRQGADNVQTMCRQCADNVQTRCRHMLALLLNKIARKFAE